MTEDQAKETRCCGPEGCGARLEHQVASMRNERGAHEGSADLLAALVLLPRYCIGAACMGWRSAAPELGAEIDRIPTEPGSMIPGPEWAYDVEGHAWVLRERIEHGFCGLAGPT